MSAIVIECILELISLIGYFISVAAFWFIFRKLKQSKWMAFIPGLRYYQLGVCVDRDKEGATLVVLEFLDFVFDISRLLIIEEMPLYINIAYYAVKICILVYTIKLYSELCRVFGRSKRWLWAFCFFEEITLLYWGLSKKFEPAPSDCDEAIGVSNSRVAPLEEGLTVNLYDRTASEFFIKKTLLRDIHLTIPMGRMVLLLGGSGAGKTTFVNAVNGYEMANAQILLHGHDVYQEYDKMKYNMGFVPQQDLMRGSDTVINTLTDAAKVKLPTSVRGKELKERVKEVLEEFGLWSLRNSLVEKLSGGQRKRLSIALEYISDPDIFFLDEPDSGLDGVVARGLFVRLRKIADENKIVVVITHTPDRVIDLFDDVIVLAKDNRRCGRLAFYGTVSDSYAFFDKKSMEDILKAINQKDEGGEGKAGAFVKKYTAKMRMGAAG